MKKMKFGRRERIDFSRIPSIMEMPDLIEFQRKSYEAFLQRDGQVEQKIESSSVCCLPDNNHEKMKC